MGFMPFHAVQELLQHVLKGDAGRFFTWIDPKPHLTDEETQTHRAHFHNGQEVAITVRHPDASRDLVDAARNANLLRGTHLASSAVHVPLVYWQFTTPSVLVREYQEGTPLSPTALREEGYDLRDVARSLFLFFAEAFVGDGLHYRYAPEHLLTVLPGSRIFVHASDQVVPIPHTARALVAQFMASYVAGEMGATLQSIGSFLGERPCAELHEVESACACWLRAHPEVPFGSAFAALVDVLPSTIASFDHLRAMSDILVHLEQEIIMLYPAFDATSAYGTLARHALSRPVRFERLPREYASAGVS